MKLNNLTIILILLILFYYPDVVNKLTETILGKLIMISIITMISVMDLLIGILLLFMVLLLHTNNNLEGFDVIKNMDMQIYKKSYKEPFITSSNDMMRLEDKLRNR